MHTRLALVVSFAIAGAMCAAPASEVNIDNVKRIMKGGADAYNGLTVVTGDLKEGASDVQRASYVELYEGNGDAGTTEIVITADEWSQWTGATVGRELGAGFAVGSATTDNITIGTNGGGVYKIFAGAAFVGPNNAIVRMAVFLNGARRGDCQASTRTTGGQADVESLAVGCLALFAAGDAIDLRFTSDGNNTITINRVNLDITRVN